MTALRYRTTGSGGDAMSYRYDPYTDSFTHVKDEESITVKIDSSPLQIIRQVELTDECIERIADAVVRKFRG